MDFCCTIVCNALEGPSSAPDNGARGVQTLSFGSSVSLVLQYTKLSRCDMLTALAIALVKQGGV